MGAVNGPGALERDAVLSCYADAVAAMGRAGRRVVHWEEPTPCGTWRALDLAGHVLAIVRYYLRLLDAAQAGAPLSGLPRGAALAEMNTNDLTALAERSGPERIEGFTRLAHEHLDRVASADWALILGTWSGLGALTLGQHTGVAVGEWHVHAWDLSRAAGADHRPQDPATVAAGQWAVGRAVGPGDPWTGVLRAYERDPGWAPPR